MKRELQLILIFSAISALAGCGFFPFTPTPPAEPPTGKKNPIIELPDVQLTSELPQFSKELNEIQIADSFNSVDPSWVIGALIEISTGNVYALDNFLKAGAKPKIIPLSEIVFNNLIENSATAKANWLDFTKASVNSNTKAEVTVAKISNISINSENIDRAVIVSRFKDMPKSERDKYGVIIGYSDFVLSATYFRNSGAEAIASGYGAKIEGNWYSKSENSSVQHRIIAVWSPLPFVIEAIKSPINKDLTDSTNEAIKDGKIEIQEIQEINHIPSDF